VIVGDSVLKFKEMQTPCKLGLKPDLQCEHIPVAVLQAPADVAELASQKLLAVVVGDGVFKFKELQNPCRLGMKPDLHSEHIPVAVLQAPTDVAQFESQKFLFVGDDVLKFKGLQSPCLLGLKPGLHSKHIPEAVLQAPTDAAQFGSQTFLVVIVGDDVLKFKELQNPCMLGVKPDLHSEHIPVAVLQAPADVAQFASQKLLVVGDDVDDTMQTPFLSGLKPGLHTTQMPVPSIQAPVDVSQ